MSVPEMLPDLLCKAEKILSEQAKSKKLRGTDFNVFSVLNIKTNEVNTHCRFIYELLNPNGSHAMKDAFLKEFFSIVLGRAYPSSPVHIYREYPITRRSNGRIDLLIEGKGFCYPIEVKINAGDQDLQIKRYADFAAYAKENQVYYLTLFGNAPSERSTGTENRPSVVCLAFSREIRAWLKKCEELSSSVLPLAVVIRQYSDLIDELTHNAQEDDSVRQLKAIVTASRENYESAAAIADIMPAVYTDIMLKVFDEIREHIGERLNLMSADYREKATEYNYGPNDKSFPSLVYHLTNQDEDISLCLIIEVYWCLYIGLACYDHDGSRLAEPSRAIYDAGNSEKWDELFSTLQLLDDWKDAWIHLLPYENPLDFWNVDGIFPNLFSHEQHREIMQQIFVEIDEMIESLDELGLIDNIQGSTTTSE